MTKAFMQRPRDYVVLLYLVCGHEGRVLNLATVVLCAGFAAPVRRVEVPIPCRACRLSSTTASPSDRERLGAVAQSQEGQR